jgi:hypothetical protein
MIRTSNLELNQRYITRDGVPGVIVALRMPNHDNLSLFVPDARDLQPSWHYADGRHISDRELDLQVINPYADFVIDEPVLVWTTGPMKHKRHFAGLDTDGRPMAWETGRTSWTSPPEDRSTWDHMERP